jgi:hypothetical protein
MSHDRDWRAACASTTCIQITEARGVTVPVVGSGALLGDRAKAIELTRNSDSHLPDARTKTSLPIRAFDLPRMLAGKEPLTSTASHALGSAFFRFIVNCAKGAEAPNVQDEPRPWLARAVLLGARMLGRSFFFIALCGENDLGGEIVFIILSEGVDNNIENPI